MNESFDTSQYRSELISVYTQAVSISNLISEYLDVYTPQHPSDCVVNVEYLMSCVYQGLNPGLNQASLNAMFAVFTKFQLSNTEEMINLITMEALSPLMSMKNTLRIEQGVYVYYDEYTTAELTDDKRFNVLVYRKE